ncbi:NAD(P)-binding domain-containing protein [Mycobacterium montefiorense]|uniref:NAD(P)-binding domain-containing protein n=1 Tax=Mycobacterium montefiorense TaxID=154654 RepID=UPI0021F3AA26|nr:NAD(P)-binding domain-containing protein [Mycobacterium montefiorense]MCV7427318.1 hypothetical protein [Mycobacterium montefiorense]
MKVGFVGAGRMGGPMVARLAAPGHDVRVQVRDPADHAQAGAVDVVDPPVSGGPHDSATSRVRDIVAARGSVAGFIEVAGELVGKDVAVVRSIAEGLGISLGALQDVLEALDVSGKV